MKRQKSGNFSVYLDNNRTGGQCRAAAYRFQNPRELITARKVSEIEPAFNRIRHHLQEGYYVAGWISYETGLSLEDKLQSLCRSSHATPFLSFGVYGNIAKLSSEDSENYWLEKSRTNEYVIENPELNISRQDYETAVDKIHKFLKAGDIYQVNFTLKSLFSFAGSPESYFAALRKAQKVQYGAFIKSDELSVLSLSPELFFQKRGRKIHVRPMKGTCPRGRTVAEDRQNADFMRNDEKNRAENLMIVDLLRNDLAKCSTVSSVKVKSLYDVEKYRTLFQMTSSIEAEVSEGIDAIDLLRALFPCGSVTGAPKIRAMEIISELENEARGIYTGAIGYMSPDGDCCFSVPIRTITISSDGQGEMGIGSAIVADSQAGAEYDECLLKAQFATGNFGDFELFETLRWSGGKNAASDVSRDRQSGYHLLDLHMARLKSSAEYFDFSCDEQAILNDLQAHAGWLEADKIWKTRLLLSQTGEISITSIPHEPEEKTALVTLSGKTVDSRNPMIFHKTTDRTLYDTELASHQREYGSYDVLFVNERGELTEGAFNNIFLKVADILYTPCLTSGLLNGTLRQSILRDPQIRLEERILTVEDLEKAEKIYMGNSLRGMVEVTRAAVLIKG